MKQIIELILLVTLTVFVVQVANASECGKYDRSEFSFKSGKHNAALRDRAGMVGKMSFINKDVRDDYTGLIEDAYAMQADHIVPLKWAWVNGACNWSKSERKIFANDMDNLALTHKFHNTSKGSKGINQWTPIGTEFDEKYISLWNQAHNKYFK